MANQATHARRLRELIAGPDTVVLPSTYDGLSARMAEAAGFDAIELSGSGAAASIAGLADVGLVTMTELLHHARGVAEAVDLPIVGDLDDGGGTPLTIQRTVRTAVNAGLAGGHIDDIATGVKFFTGYPRQLVGFQEGVDRVAAAADARTDADFVIVARTYTPDPSEAFDRMSAYAEAGADLLFPTAMDLDKNKEFSTKLSKPLYRAMTHLDIPQQDFVDAGIKVICTMQPFLVAVKTMRAAYEELKATGGIADVPGRCATPSQFRDLLCVDEATHTAEKYHMISK